MNAERGRSRKQQERDREAIHGMEEKYVSVQAIRKFRTKPYECAEISREVVEKLKTC